MSEPLKPKRIHNLGIYGTVRPAEVDDSLIPDGAVTEAVNVHFDTKGAVTVRPGLTALGSTVLAGKPVYGIHNVQNATAIAVLSNGSTSAIYSYGTSSTPSAWAMTLDGGTSSIRFRFVDFGSYSIALNFNYDTYTSMRFWSGGSRTWHHTGRPINPQNMWGYANQLGEVYKSRVYLTGDTSTQGNKSRLYFSSIISSTGNITWDPTTDYVDINPGDGEGNSGLKRFGLELLVFKPNYIYRFKTTGVDPDPMVKKGTRSQESLVEGKNGLYFHHDSGFFLYTGSTIPIEISRPISDIVAAIPYSQFDDIVGWNDGDHIYWSVGNVTVSETTGSVTIKNAVLRYTESSQVWTVYSYASNPTAGMSFNNQSSLTRIVGLDNGVVATHNVGTTDLGEPIKFRMRTKWFEFGTISETKVIEELVAVCEKAQGTVRMYQTDESADWKTIKQAGGTLTKLINVFDQLDIKFNRIRFLLTGVTRFDAPIFREIQVVKGVNRGIEL